MSVEKFTRKELETRNTRQNAIIIIDNIVYDITNFLEDHPGGLDPLLNNIGSDASKCFHEVGHSEVALEWRQNFVIGEVVDEDKWKVLKREDYITTEDEPITFQTILNVWATPVLLAVFATIVYVYIFS